jgi:hypothetical protein
MTASNFTTDGLPIGQNNVNMTYMYGIADFFQVMFQDTSVVNLLLESTTQGAAEVYSRFLQLTSTLSLQTISETVGSSIKLFLISSNDAVKTQVNTFTLTETVSSARYIANKPLLPTTTIEQNVDFGFTEQTDGSTTITFAQDITSYGFASQVQSDGSTQYALWFVDVEIDERMISTYFADLIQVSPENSTDAFYNFVYGLYYVYTQGPTLDTLTKGLNLCLGIPLCRGTETVLDVRQYLNTDQYIVITDQNQYVIPYGLMPSVTLNQVLTVGQELAQWVQVQDYLNNGEWWINLQIPANIIPSLPDGQKDRYATAGSHYDYLMRNYLKKHTFLVNVNVANFENIQSFQQISDIIGRAKPSYTQPIYIWSVSALDETITLDDDLFIYSVEQDRCEALGNPIARFYRNNSDNPLSRGCPNFIRFNVPMMASRLCGTDTYIDGDPTSLSINGSTLTGFTNNIGQWRTPTETETGWEQAIMTRGNGTWGGARSEMGFRRGSFSGSDANGIPFVTDEQIWGVPSGSRMVPLYVTTNYDIANKCIALNMPPPPSSIWSFTLFAGNGNSQAINEIAIDAGTSTYSSQILINNYNICFFRTASVNYITMAVPDGYGWETYAPPVGQIGQNDYLMGIRINDTAVGVYWITTNFSVDSPAYFPVSEPDPLVITYNMPLTRGGGTNGSPAYMLRGRGTLDYSSTDEVINGGAINSELENSPTISQTYIDKYNSTPVTIDRSGVSLVHAVESS